MTEVALRVGDAERESAVSALGVHLAAGRISLEEFDERAGRAWAAQYSADLADLFSDLPPPQGLAAAPRSQSRGRQRPRRSLFPAVPIAIALVVILANAAPWLLLALLMLWLLGSFHTGHPLRRQRRASPTLRGLPTGAHHLGLCRFSQYGRV
ncbi:DUF1707 domain-containing protein [Hoyosella sp. YIM 151337]|uniref:DUF1707 SHOCT-like domain-containing protein n=1 Tax=Hoyosella sp. YIM 151337 TaxID=2992742 RepID=UPI002235CB64|nr:DUF1707 domain-containing protein [Hoyosella sp. YIM 151337]MCW4354544.1 DUF1707 domain-containing protein [Hoyosella sp. YIM 151337]